jgi:hypothetical protein
MLLQLFDAPQTPLEQTWYLAKVAVVSQRFAPVVHSAVEVSVTQAAFWQIMPVPQTLISLHLPLMQVMIPVLS